MVDGQVRSPCLQMLKGQYNSLFLHSGDAGIASQLTGAAVM